MQLSLPPAAAARPSPRFSPTTSLSRPALSLRSVFLILNTISINFKCNIHHFKCNIQVHLPKMGLKTATSNSAGNPTTT